MKALNAALTKHEKFFIHTGTYLIIEKLKSIAFRTLFRKVHLILGSYQIPLKKLVSVLETQGVSISSSLSNELKKYLLQL